MNEYHLERFTATVVITIAVGRGLLDLAREYKVPA